MPEMTTDLFDEFCSDVLCIEGLGLKYKGAAITQEVLIERLLKTKRKDERGIFYL